MNSKQINFFLLPEEKNNIINYFRNLDVIIIPNKIDKNNYLNKEYLIESNLFLNENKFMFQFILTNCNFITKVALNENAETKLLSVDMFKSYSVELTLDFFYLKNKVEINSSRLYFITKYWENLKLINKSDEFVSWANNLIKNFKKNFLDSEFDKSGFYISTGIKSLEVTNSFEIYHGNKLKLNKLII